MALPSHIEEFHRGEKVTDPAFRDKLNALVDAARAALNLRGGPWVRVTRGAGGLRISVDLPAGGGGDETFPARITGSSWNTSNYHGKYAWEEVQRDGDGWAVVPGGRSGTTTVNYAINGEEDGHTSTYAWGINLTGTDVANSNNRPRPIGGGGSDDTHKYDRVVAMTESVDANGNTVYSFHAMGSLDGGC